MEPGFKWYLYRIILKGSDTSDYISESKDGFDDNKKDNDLSLFYSKQCFIYTGNDQESVKRNVVKSLLKNHFSEDDDIWTGQQTLVRANSRYGQGSGARNNAP
jgi:hypothetical protein